MMLISLRGQTLEVKVDLQVTYPKVAGEAGFQGHQTSRYAHDSDSRWPPSIKQGKPILVVLFGWRNGRPGPDLCSKWRAGCFARKAAQDNSTVITTPEPESQR